MGLVLQCGCVERGQVDAGAGGLLRALRRRRDRRLLRGPGRVTGSLGGARRPGARARGLARRGAAGSADPRGGPGDRTATAPAGILTHGGSRSSGSTPPAVSGGWRRRRSARSRPSTWSSRFPRASASCTHSATNRPAAPSTRRTLRPGRRRSVISRTKPASFARVRVGLSVSTRTASSSRPTSTALRGRRTRTCTRI